MARLRRWEGTGLLRRNKGRLLGWPCVCVGGGGVRLQRSGWIVQGQANPAKGFGLYPGGSREPWMVLEPSRDRS